VSWWHIEGDLGAQCIASSTWLIFEERDLYSGWTGFISQKFASEIDCDLHTTEAVKQLNSVPQETFASDISTEY
jgi:hypothetical protein